MNTIINFLFAAIKAGTPLLLGTTGEIITEKSGSLNLGVEGLMYMGAFAGFYAGYKTNSVIIAVIASMLMAMFGALIFAFLTVTLQANQNVTGLTLTIFGSGLSIFFGQQMINNEGGKPSMSVDFMAKLAEEPLPLLGDIPVVGKILFSHNPLVYLAVVIAILAWIYIRFTRAGLNMRAVGENAAAADASGINVNRVKYMNILLGGGVCGIGGAYIAIINSYGGWDNGCINGQGWISVALVIFASWSPAKAILGSLVFGAFSAFQIRANEFASAFPALSFLAEIPSAIYVMLPFLLTAIILIFTSIRGKREGAQPANCGINYYREER
ncbi:MAG: ABC transporter permease [Clostridia bacterium]|nr:ABC transporter permease [Clostridia bacterium]MBQ4575775.1 ABC transporter permease [Clostridia bacterium]